MSFGSCCAASGVAAAMVPKLARCFSARDGCFLHTKCVFTNVRSMEASVGRPVWAIAATNSLCMISRTRCYAGGAVGGEAPADRPPQTDGVSAERESFQNIGAAADAAVEQDGTRPCTASAISGRTSSVDGP